MNLLHKIKHLFSISLVMVKNIAHVLFSTLLTVSKSIEYYVRDLGLFIARAFLGLLSKFAKVMYYIDVNRLKSYAISLLVNISDALKSQAKKIKLLQVSYIKSIKVQLNKLFQFINPLKMVKKIQVFNRFMSKVVTSKAKSFHSYKESKIQSLKKKAFAYLHVNPLKILKKLEVLSSRIKEAVVYSYGNISSAFQSSALKLLHLTRLFSYFSARKIIGFFSYINPFKILVRVYLYCAEQCKKALRVINPKKIFSVLVYPFIVLDKILGRAFDESIKAFHHVNQLFNKGWNGVKKVLFLINPLILVNFLFIGAVRVASYQKSLYKRFLNSLLKLISIPLSILRKTFLAILEIANKVVEIISNAVYGFIWVVKLPYHSMVISGRVLALSTAHTSNYLANILRNIHAFIARILGVIRVYLANIKKALDFTSMPQKLKDMWSLSHERVDRCIDTANTILKTEAAQENPRPSNKDMNVAQKDNKFTRVLDKIEAIFRFIRMILTNRFNNLVNAISIESKKIIEKNEKEAEEVHSPIHRAINSRPNRAVMIMLFSFSGLIVAFLIFASIWEIPRYANAKGRIETYDQLQTIMAFDGAVVEKILVEEDQQVLKGQELIRFDKTVFEAKYKDLQEKYYSKLGLISSIEARAANIPLILDDSIKNYSQRIYDEVMLAHKAAINVYETNYELINSQLIRKEKEVEEETKDKSLYIEQLELVKKQLNILSKLADSELVSKLRLIDTQKEMLSTQIKLKNVEANLVKAEGELRELENRKSNFLSSYNKDLLNDLTITRNELSTVVADIASVKDLLNRSVISSPINGVIYRISTRAVPGHAISGQEIITIVPSDGGLVMTGLVMPSEIGFVKKGQKVNIKIATYDYSVYGTLSGIVERISPETIQSKTDGLYYYEVVVKSDHNYIEYKGKKFYIKPGMDASADFDMDSRTLLRYILDPFVKTISESFSEK
jgi:adhesin transport system membrane fusion protein